MNHKKTLFLVQGAVIAALYAALTYAAGLAGLAYGNVQFRFSEALTVLAAFTPAAIPGLTVGCLLGNLGSPYGAADIICGTLATLLAALCSYGTRKIRIKGIPFVSLIFPVLFNCRCGNCTFSARGIFRAGISDKCPLGGTRRIGGLLCGRCTAGACD